MPGNKRVDASAAYTPKKQTALEKMIVGGQTDASSTAPTAPKEQPEGEREAGGPKGRTLKQVAFAIGTKREQKLDELAFAYNREKGTRIGRNDIARWLFDTLTLDEVLQVDLIKYKK